LLIQDVAIRACDDHIHDIVDSHEPFDKLTKRHRVFRDEASKPKAIVVHDVGEQNGPELLQVVRHGRPPRFHEIPAQRRTREDENEAEEGDELRAQADEPERG
jgi:hypothetical protein